MFKVYSAYRRFHFQTTCICPSFSNVMQNTLKHICMCELSAQYHRTNTLKVKIPHLNFAQISPCKTISKQGTYIKI